jgi:hypothetical protein
MVTGYFSRFHLRLLQFLPSIIRKILEFQTILPYQVYMDMIATKDTGFAMGL